MNDGQTCVKTTSLISSQITLNGDWVEPWDPADSADVEACERKLEFSIGWFADPVYHGDYPASMPH